MSMPYADAPIMTVTYGRTELREARQNRPAVSPYSGSVIVGDLHRVTGELVSIVRRSLAPVQRFAHCCDQPRIGTGWRLNSHISVKGAGSRHPGGRESPALRAHGQTARLASYRETNRRAAICFRRGVSRARRKNLAGKLSS